MNAGGFLSAAITASLLSYGPAHFPSDTPVGIRDRAKRAMAIFCVAQKLALNHGGNRRYGGR